jgi:Fe-S-cluster containining protein
LRLDGRRDSTGKYHARDLKPRLKERRHDMTVDQTQRFGCVKCGLCCQGWRVSLFLDEATAWVRRGHAMELLVEGAPYRQSDYDADPAVAYKVDRSFRATAGTSRLYVRAILVGALRERCPNLGEDNLCAIHAARPLVCRIYPAEFHPLIAFDKGNKKCPPEAWGEKAGGEHDILLSRDGAYRPPYADVIAAARAAGIRDARYMARICHLLSVGRCALAGEGYAVYPISPARFLRAVQQALMVPDDQLDACDDAYEVMSHRRPTIDALTAGGVACALASPDGATLPGEPAYLAFNNDAT